MDATTPPAVTRALGAFGGHVRAWRKLNRLTMAQVADRADVSPDTLARLESGKSVSLENTFRVMRAMGMLDTWVRSADPLSTEVGQLRALDQLPTRVRTSPTRRS